MVEQANIHNPASTQKVRRESRVQRVLEKTIFRPLWCSVLASFGIFGGIASLFIGLLFVVLHGVVKDDQIFDKCGTDLLIVAIPMILVGSIFLDEVQRNK